MPSGKPIDESDKQQMRKVVTEATDGNCSEAARRLGFHRTTVSKYVGRRVLRNRQRRK